jgi:hypothetical protein
VYVRSRSRFAEPPAVRRRDVRGECRSGELKCCYQVDVLYVMSIKKKGRTLYIHVFDGVEVRVP